MRHIPLRRDQDAVARVERALAARLQGDLEISDTPTHDAARLFWRQRAWSEDAAAPALSRVVVTGIVDGASIDEASALTGMLHDEPLHAQLARRAAEAVGGYVDACDDDRAFDPVAFAQPTWVPRLLDIVLIGCRRETLSRGLLEAGLARTRHEGLRTVFERTSPDERVHSALAWAVAERDVPALEPEGRRALVVLVAPHVEAARRGTRGLTMPPRAREPAEVKEGVHRPTPSPCAP